VGKIKINYFFIIIFIFLVGCSTQKNTGLNRFYHALTTKYNILFNGGESFKEGINYYRKNYQDDYSRILPVFTYGDEEIASGLKPQMNGRLKNQANQSGSIP